ncbi:secondary thiamine-phosphate synthase enzyme YjbQ [Pyrobaculum aerophilum]|uniref:secondary thiamine-phosphate synthase enzyme YjbQ n=1 Tax=Pyrobaculum aerophilum TaxID=13773 RepID=UPI0023EF8413|nr:secondary thiamine-phosphate synthase enzyme YjbQ [Pyrobaculum aerophilum]MCX8136173.1 secondary thiamine-phosphate synthase enzyme YjbQ [Pyrobaculum aerophilum]
MKVYVEELRVSTRLQEDIVVITEQVERVVEKSGVKNGLALIYLPHATAIVTANENEPRLKDDILNKVRALFPRGAGYRHDEIDDNANAHLANIFLGFHVVMPVVGGKLRRGTWQELMLIEMDGPRSRNVVVVVIGD